MNQIFKNKYFSVLVLISLVIAGFALRFSELKTDFWYDEAFTGILVRQDWGEMLRMIIVDKVHPPTFYFLLKAWTLLFGSDVNGIRSFTMLFGLMSIPLSYLVGSNLAKEKEKGVLLGLFAAALFTFSPFFITYSGEARSYSLFGFLGLLSLYFFLKSEFAENRRWVYLVLFIAALALTMYTHYLGALIALGYVFAYIVKFLQKKDGFGIKDFWFYFWLLAILSLVALVVGGYYFGLIDYVKSHTNWIWWVPQANLLTFFRSITGFLFGVDRHFQGVPPYHEFRAPIGSLNIAVGFFIIMVIQAALLWNRLTKDGNRKEVGRFSYISIITFIPFAAVITLACIGQNSFIDRYMTVAGAYLLIWFAFVLVNAFEKKALIILVLYILSTAYLVYPQPLTKYLELRENVIASAEAEGIKEVVYESPTDFVLMRYYIASGINDFVVLPSGWSNYEVWVVIDAASEVSSYRECPSHRCLYVLPKDDNSEVLIEKLMEKVDGISVTTYKETEHYYFYIVESSLIQP